MTNKILYDMYFKCKCKIRPTCQFRMSLMFTLMYTLVFFWYRVDVCCKLKLTQFFLLCPWCHHAEQDQQT